MVLESDIGFAVPVCETGALSMRVQFPSSTQLSYSQNY